MGKQAFGVLTVLDTSIWVPPATYAAFHDAKSFARCYRSSLWEVPTDACSCAELAATVEINGQVEWHSNRTFCRGGGRYRG
jgi:hypothetical protein